MAKENNPNVARVTGQGGTICMQPDIIYITMEYTFQSLRPESSIDDMETRLGKGVNNSPGSQGRSCSAVGAGDC